MERIRPKRHQSQHGVYDRWNSDDLESSSASHLLNLKGRRYDNDPPRLPKQEVKPAKEQRP